MDKIERLVIEVGSKKYEHTGGGGTTIIEGQPIPKDTVDSLAIEDGSIKMEDLSDDVRSKMTGEFATDDDVKAVLGL